MTPSSDDLTYFGCIWTTLLGHDSSYSHTHSTVHDDQVEDLPEGASQTPDEQEAPDTPAEGVESPNETGTIIKNPASREPTPQINGPINKR